jgi:hypothetical protein
MTDAVIRRVLLTGDVHGNAEWMLEHVFPQAQRQKCDLILQMGGLWDLAGPQRGGISRPPGLCG